MSTKDLPCYCNQSSFYLAHVQDVLGLLAVKVGNSNVLCQALFHHFFHSSPSHSRIDTLVKLGIFNATLVS